MKQLWQNSQLLADIASKKAIGVLDIYYQNEYIRVKILEGDWILLNVAHKDKLDKILQDWDNVRLVFTEDKNKPAILLSYNFVASLWKNTDKYFDNYSQELFDKYLKNTYLVSTHAKVYWISSSVSGPQFLEVSLPIIFFKNGDKTIEDFLRTYRHKPEKELKKVLFQLLIAGYLKVKEKPISKVTEPARTTSSTGDTKNNLLKLLSKLQNKQ